MKGLRNLLLVAATPTETELLRTHYEFRPLQHSANATLELGPLRILLTHTGPGIANCALSLGGIMALGRPQLALQFGIGGSFPDGPDMLEVVEVRTEIYGDLGADSPSGFLDLEAISLPNFRVGEQVIYNEMDNPGPANPNLRHCRGLTVNKVHGQAEEIVRTIVRLRPEVESMEGAAFFQACLMHEVPFHEFRAISNAVEPRNREAWRIPEASEAMQRFMIQYLQQLADEA